MNKLYAMAAFAVAVTTSGARAGGPDVWAEIPDAGNLPGTAQVTTGVGPLTAITGILSGVGDADMYLITINSPATFSASTVGTAGFDTQLFLFTTAGIGIATNDDVGTGPLTSLLPAGNPLYSGLTPGQYLLAISGFDTDPSNGSGLLFPSTFPGVFGPTGPGGPFPVDFWTGGGTGGIYAIELTGARFAPGPASVALVGLAGLMTSRRRRA